MKRVIKFFKKTYYDVLQSIAFYPVFISFGFFVFSMGILELENTKTVLALKKNLSYLFIQDFETARSILSTFIGGILSLTVFSFTMVMVVLSQASSNFSPSLLPNLISNKKHQVILGVYIGTLLYCTIVLIYLGAYGIDSKSMGLSTMLAAIFAIICIGFFVYFIHSISTAIQINNITKRIFDTSMAHIETTLNTNASERVELSYVDTAEWHTITIGRNGYYRSFDVSLIQHSILEQENQIEVVPYTGQHLWEGDPVLRTKKPINENERENLLFCLNISSKRNDGDEDVGGMIKLMEIAVKALSPGINDPGTAIGSISYLAQLIHDALQFPKITSAYVRNSQTLLIKNYIKAEELMRTVVQPIRHYAKSDISVLYELLGAIRYIATAPNLTKEDRDALAREREALIFDIEKNIDNPIDRERILGAVQGDRN